MKKIFILMVSVLMLSLTSCQTDYFEPVFGYDNLPEVMSQRGGIYKLTYCYEYYDTRAAFKENFEWEYRVLIDGKEYYRDGILDLGRAYTAGSKNYYYFTVDIPENRSIWPRSIVVEVSTHVDMDYEDWWGDWTPVASGVQLGI